MSYVATAIVRTARGWEGAEMDLDDIADLDSAADRLRDLLGEDDPGPALLFVEENDEYVAIVRVDADVPEARSFISDARATETSDLAAALYDESAVEPLGDEDDDEHDDEEESATAAEAEPGGDDAILTDVGTKPAALRDLCAEEGMLPADVIYALCERGGFLDVLEELRGV